MMNYRKGIKLALLTAIFSGFAIFFNGRVVQEVGDPLLFTTLKNLGVAVIIASVLVLKTSRRMISWRKISKPDWLRLVVIGIIGGSLPFYLFFKGLSITSSAQASLIHKTLIFWVALWVIPILKERIRLKQLLALVLVFGSNFVIGGLGKFHWGTGETMILIATMLWGVENAIAKVTLRNVEVDVVVGSRMILGSILLLVAALITGKLVSITKLNLQQWSLTLLTVGLLTGYVMTWYRALKRAPATLVATILTLGAVITNLLSSIFVTYTLKLELVYQAILLIAGVWFFAIAAKRVLESEQLKIRLSA